MIFLAADQSRAPNQRPSLDAAIAFCLYFEVPSPAPMRPNGWSLPTP
jgi:hypothetical protein